MKNTSSPTGTTDSRSSNVSRSSTGTTTSNGNKSRCPNGQRKLYIGLNTTLEQINMAKKNPCIIISRSPSSITVNTNVKAPPRLNPWQLVKDAEDKKDPLFMLQQNIVDLQSINNDIFTYGVGEDRLRIRERRLIAIADTLSYLEITTIGKEHMEKIFPKHKKKDIPEHEKKDIPKDIPQDIVSLLMYTSGIYENEKKEIRDNLLAAACDKRISKIRQLLVKLEEALKVDPKNVDLYMFKKKTYDNNIIILNNVKNRITSAKAEEAAKAAAAREAKVAAAKAKVAAAKAKAAEAEAKAKAEAVSTPASSVASSAVSTPASSAVSTPVSSVASSDVSSVASSDVSSPPSSVTSSEVSTPAESPESVPPTPPATPPASPSPQTISPASTTSSPANSRKRANRSPTSASSLPPIPVRNTGGLQSDITGGNKTHKHKKYHRKTVKSKKTKKTRKHKHKKQKKTHKK